MGPASLCGTAEKCRRARRRPVRAAREPPVGTAGLVALADEAPDDDFGGARELRRNDVLGIGMTTSPPEARVGSAVGRHQNIHAH